MACRAGITTYYLLPTTRVEDPPEVCPQPTAHSQRPTAKGQGPTANGHSHKDPARNADKKYMSENTSLSVLVVEDDPEYARLLGAFLKRRGHKVTIAQDGVQGQRLARIEQPDVITMDHRLPAGLGTAVSRRLGESIHTSRIPIIMLTGSPLGPIEPIAREAGVVAVLSKLTLTEQVLVDAIESAVSPDDGEEVTDLGGLFPVGDAAGGWSPDF